MAREVAVAEILELNVADRLRALEEIWESLSAHPESVPVTEAQREVLDRRLAEHDARPDDVITWDELDSQPRKP